MMDLDGGFGAVRFRKISVEEVIDFLDGKEIVSAVGHQSTADVLTTMLGRTIKANRIMISLKPGDEMIIATLGFRPEEGRIYDKDELMTLGVQFTHARILFENMEGYWGEIWTLHG